MALTITTDLTVITNGNDGTWTDIGGGSGSAAETDYFIQGTGCRSRAVSGASASRGMTVDIGSGNELDFSAAGTEEDMLVYFWIQDYTPGLTDNVATAPGLTIRIAEGATNGTNYAEWDIMYSDLLAAPGTDLFRVYVLDPRAPATRTSGTWDYNTCRHFGAKLDTNATAKGSNLGIDRICYGFGEITATGTSTTESSGFEEIIDENWRTVNDSVAIGSNSTARNGLIVNKAGINFLKGKIIIGDDAGTLATDFQAQDTILVWEDTFYYDGTRIRSTVGYDDNQNYTGRKSDDSAYYGIEFVGNATNDTDVTLGAQVGTDQGRSGPTIIGSALTPTELIADDGSVEGVSIFASTFENFRYLDFSSNAATDLIYSCNFKKCGTLRPGPTSGRRNNFIRGLGGNYFFLENFLNQEASGAEQLSTADPSTEWTDIVNGADWSVPAADSGYLELLGGTARTNLTVLDDSKAGSATQYCEFVFTIPTGGTNQGTFGPVTNMDNTGTQDYYWMEVDFVNDQVELFRVDTGTATSIAGPTSFTMDAGEEYVAILFYSQNRVQGFVSGYSAADDFHTVKFNISDSTHNAVAHNIVGLRGDANASQTGGAPRIRQFGNSASNGTYSQLASLEMPQSTVFDHEDSNFVQCVRGVAWSSFTGTYSMDNINLSGNLVAVTNKTEGNITASFIGTGVPDNTELFLTSTNTFTADVPISVHAVDEAGNDISGALVGVYKTSDRTEIYQTTTTAGGLGDGVYNYDVDTEVEVRIRKASSGSTKYRNFSTKGIVTASGYSLLAILQEDTNNNATT